jgi:NADH-quinone oxidoreductase subunit N
MVIFFIKIYYYVLFDIVKLKNTIILIISLLTLVLGSLGALYQKRIKKLISYSTITVTGFFLYSIFNLNIVLLESSLMYLFVYIIMSILLLILLLNIYLNDKIMVKLTDLFNIYYLNKSLTFVFIVLIFTLTGIPPFLIFISKLF